MKISELFNIIITIPYLHAANIVSHPILRVISKKKKSKTRELGQYSLEWTISTHPLTF